MTTEDSPKSPRLVALQKRLATGDSAVLATFWEEVAQQGTPLIEPIVGDGRHSLLTFIWRATVETQNVKVVNNLSRTSRAEAMTHLPESDLWYRSYRVRNDLRETYQFAIAGNNIADPLNPRQHVFPDDEEIGFTGWVSSVFALPEVPPYRWGASRSDVPKGEVNKHSLHSADLDDDYRVWVYTPPGYSADGAPYGFLLIMDGWLYVHVIPAPTVLDNLAADGVLPPLVAIMVGDTFVRTRGRDLSCSQKFLDFLTDELLPWARQRYHITRDPAQTALAGASLGGLQAAFGGLQRPDLFGNILSQSGAFGWKPDGDEEYEWLARQYVSAPRLPLRFYLDVGRGEISAPDSKTPSFLITNRHLRDVLQAKGYPVHYAEFSGGHNPVHQHETLADGLLALVGNGRSDNED